MQCQCMDLLHFLLQGLVDHSVTLDQHLIVERIADDSNLEVRFRARGNIMPVAFILDLQEIGIKFTG